VRIVNCPNIQDLNFMANEQLNLSFLYLHDNPQMGDLLSYNLTLNTGRIGILELVNIGLRTFPPWACQPSLFDDGRVDLSYNDLRSVPACFLDRNPQLTELNLEHAGSVLLPLPINIFQADPEV
jgi:hypothetical protein